jgi:CRP/FNR family transcriptional regulator
MHDAKTAVASAAVSNAAETVTTDNVSTTARGKRRRTWSALSSAAVSPVTAEISPRSRCVTLVNEQQSDCARCGMRLSALFGAIDPSKFADELKSIHNGIVRENSVIYRQGDVADAVFTIRTGLIKLVHQNESEEIVRLLGRGGAIGLEAASGGRYEHTVVAIRDLNLCRIPASTLRVLMEQHPRLLSGLADQWREHATLSEQWISTLSRGKHQDRVASLIRLIVKISGDSPNAVRLPRTAEMAAILDSSPTYLSRWMATLKRKRLLTRIGPWLYRCDPSLIEPP